MRMGPENGNPNMKENRYYILISILFWIMAEYIASWHGRIAEWASAMPWIFIYYVEYPLIFYYVIFNGVGKHKALS
jgi:hypothetical protein